MTPWIIGEEANIYIINHDEYLFNINIFTIKDPIDMKTNKKTNISEAAMQAMGLGDYDATGKGSFDLSGRGPMTPAPVVMGNPATTPAPAPVVPNGMAVVMGAKGAAAPAAEEEQTEGEETEAEDTEEEEQMAEEARVQFRSALASLLGEEIATEDLVSKLEGIFEAAVSDRVEKTVATIVQDVDGNVKQYLDNVTESLVEKVDDYLDYVVEEWMTENAVAVEQGIKTQIAENFINGLKNLFENHYIDVPNEKYNVLDELYAQNRQLESKLNESVNAAINLRKQVELTECAGIFVAETRDLADTQVAKLQSLMENVSFDSANEYRDKLIAIKENYLNSNKPSVTRSVEPEETFTAVRSAPTTLVEGYMGALGRLNKKV